MYAQDFTKINYNPFKKQQQLNKFKTNYRKSIIFTTIVLLKIKNKALQISRIVSITTKKKSEKPCVTQMTPSQQLQIYIAIMHTYNRAQD